MSKLKSGLKILTSMADIQESVADILESKAVEMEALRDWVLHTVRESEFTTDHDMVMQSCGFHDQLIHILDGITKMERGFARHMELLLEEDDMMADAGTFDGMEDFGGQEG